MPDAWLDILDTMIEDARAIIAFVDSVDEAAFAGDRQKVFAVCYAFIRLGQGASDLAPEVRDRHPEVPWPQVRQFRNFLVHVYRAVDAKRLHSTPTTSIPALLDALVQMRRSYPA